MSKKPASIETLTRQLHTLTVQRDNARKLAERYREQRDDAEERLSSLRGDAGQALKEAERLRGVAYALMGENARLRSQIQSHKQFIDIIETLSKRP